MSSSTNDFGGNEIVFSNISLKFVERISFCEEHRKFASSDNFMKKNTFDFSRKKKSGRKMSQRRGEAHSFI